MSYLQQLRDWSGETLDKGFEKLSKQENIPKGCAGAGKSEVCKLTSELSTGAYSDYDRH